MEEFFETGTIPEEHLVPALHEAIREDKLFPVLFTSGLGNIGVDELMDFIVDYTPAASEHHAITEWTADGRRSPPPARARTMSLRPYMFSRQCRMHLRDASLTSRFFRVC